MNKAAMGMAVQDKALSEMYALTKTSQAQNCVTTGLIDFGYYQNCWPPRYQYWPCPDVVVNSPRIVVEDKTKKAFAIAKKFLKMKWAKADKIEDFIELVEAIEREL